MSISEIITFKEAINRTKNIELSLLIGNGFSMPYFRYENLLDHANFESESPVSKLFKNHFETVDFELVIRALEDAATVADAYDLSDNSRRFRNDANEVRKGLVHAVRKVHHFLDLCNCPLDYSYPADFIRKFSKVFSLNYDLLLYFMNLDQYISLTDGFGLGESIGDFRGPFKKEAHCTMFNLHGGLHLFLKEDGQVEKCIINEKNLISTISNTILNKNRLPLYVAEGKWEAKMKKINSVAYLRHCYDQLNSSEGVLFIYGHSANDNDSHIYNAIFKSNINHVYFSINNEQKLNEYDSQLSKFQKLFQKRDKEINYTFFYAESAEVWTISRAPLRWERSS